MTQILKEADSFVDSILSASEVYYIEKGGEEVLVDMNQRNNIVIEVLNTMIVFMNDDLTPSGNQAQIQSMVGDIATLRIWKLCFLNDSKVSSTIKGLAHKVLVGFFDELPQQYLVQTSDKFIAEGIIEGLFNFVWTTEQPELHIYFNTIYLISRLVVNKKIERMLQETDLVAKSLRKLLQRDVFIKTYMKKGKDHLCNHFTTIAEALFDIANSSDACSLLLEGVVIDLLDTYTTLCKQVTSLYQHYLVTGVLPSMIDERITLFCDNISNDPVEIGRFFSFFEEYSQVFLHFFRKFLDVEASNLTVKILEKGYLEKIMDLFLEISLPSWTAVNDRAHIFIDIFSNLGYHGATASKVQVNFLKNVCLPKLVELFDSISVNLPNIDNQAITSVLTLVNKQTPNNPLPTSILGLGFTSNSFGFLQDFTRIAFLCAICTNSGIGPALSSQNNFISESDFLKIVDIYVNHVNQRLFPIQAPLFIQMMREVVGKASTTDSAEVLTKDLKENLSSIRSQNLLFKISITLLNLYNTQFQGNFKVASQLFAKLGNIRGPLSIEGNIDFAQSIIQHLELLSLSAPFIASIDPLSITAMVAIFESGLFNTLSLACQNLVSLVSAFLVLMKTEERTIDHVIITITLNHRMANIPQDSIYSLLQKTVASQDKFYREGNIIAKNIGAGKARFVKLKLYEGLNSLVLGILKAKSENFTATKLTAENYRASLNSSGPFLGKIEKDSTEKIKKSYRELLVYFLKLAISLQVKDNFGDNDRSNAERPRANVPRIVINKLLELGFDEQRIKFAGTKVRNPSDFNEIFEWLLSNPDAVEPQGGEKMDEEAPQGTTTLQGVSSLLDCPAKDANEYKAERVEQYKRFCQTLIRYFLFIPKSVDFVSLLSNYTSHVHDNSNSGKSSRQFLFDLYYLFVDFLILLRSQLSKLKPGQDLDSVEINLPPKFNKVKVVRSD
jgi:hypothetical protein